MKKLISKTKKVETKKVETKKEIEIMKIGYARVSTQDQNLDRQIDQLTKAGCTKIYQEKITGTKKERPELDDMLKNIRQGDIIIICDLTRLSRSTKDLITLAEEIKKKGAELISLKENLDTTTATGKMMFGMFAVIAQFERDILSERTKQGLESARARGRFGGRKKTDTAIIKKALTLYKSNEYSIEYICTECGISKNNLYNYIRADKAGKE